jgi:hypothetical protein
MKRCRPESEETMKPSKSKKNIKVTEARTYTPLSHDYADLFANLVAALELCAATEELLEIWENKLKDENSKQLLQRMIVILARALDIWDILREESSAYTSIGGNANFLKWQRRFAMLKKSLKPFLLTNRVLKGLRESRRSLIGWQKLSYGN